jgi:anti-anti-sigma factor
MERRGSVTIEEHGDVKVVRLVGDHDISTASDVRAQLEAPVLDGGVVVSLAEIDFLDSSVIHALYEADKRLRQRDRRLVLHVGTPTIVERVLVVSGLKAQVCCTGSLQEAIVLAEHPAGSAERKAE